MPPAFTKRNHLARGGKKTEKENKRDILDQLKSMGKRAGLGREKKGTSGSSSASMGEQRLLNKPHTPPTLPNSPLGGRCSTAIFKMPAEHPPPRVLDEWGENKAQIWSVLTLFSLLCSH